MLKESTSLLIIMNLMKEQSTVLFLTAIIKTN